MNNNTSKKAKKIDKKHRFRLTKKSSTVLVSIVAVLLILGGVFGFVSLQLGTTDYKAFVPNIKLGLDLAGGVYAVYEAKRPTDLTYTDDDFKNAIKGSAKTLEDLLFSKGFPEAQVSTSGSQLRVEVPAVDDQQDIFDLIGRPSSLEMYETDEKGTKTDPSAKPYITGKDIKSANVARDADGKFVVSLKFNKEGTKKFADATTALKGKRIGIFINKEFKLAPTVNDAITNGEASIEGDYDYEQATELAIQLQSGAMAVELTLLESDTISPTLGANATRDGLIAGAVGLLLIMIFMCFRYRMLGVAASVSLIFFTLTYLFFLSIFPWVQLTLPGIAGVLLAIGMAVDANVIIFERIKEVRQSGKNLLRSIDEGFKNSYSAILDGNITTIIGALVLMILPVAASIKGFAITLFIGIIISLFSSLIFTRVMLKCMTAFNDGSDKLYGTSGEAIDYTIYDDSDSLDNIAVIESNSEEGTTV